MAEMTMQCSPKCRYFPDVTCTKWKYDEENPYIKVRQEKKDYICGYDGHIITNWYSPCPRMIDKKVEEVLNKEKKK